MQRQTKDAHRQIEYSQTNTYACATMRKNKKW